MLKRDLSDLPKAVPVSFEPVRDNVIAERLADNWFDKYIEDGNAAKARAIPELPYRASYASKRCDRQLYYALSDTPESEPLTPASAWTMGIGTMIHDAMQSVIEELWPDAECEPTIDLTAIGIPGSGHADMVLTDEDGSRTLVELKTTGGFSFKMMATSFKGGAQGPRFSYVLQAAMMAKALGIKKFIIALLSLEPVSPQLAETYASSESGRFAAEWHFNTSDFDDVLSAEASRVTEIMEAVKAQRPPARRLRDPEYPNGATVINPVAARAPWTVTVGDNVTDTGTYWGCAYCSWRSQCNAD